MNSKVVLDAQNFNNLEEFYHEIYGLMKLYDDWKPAYNLDTLNDMLYSGFGEHETELIWENSEKSKSDLGKTATIQFYQNKINQGKPFNVNWAKEKLNALNENRGQTLFEILVEIFETHPKIKLNLN